MCRELLLAGRWADVLHLAEAASLAASPLRVLDRHVLGHMYCCTPAVHHLSAALGCAS